MTENTQEVAVPESLAAGSVTRVATRYALTAAGTAGAQTTLLDRTESVAYADVANATPAHPHAD